MPASYVGYGGQGSYSYFIAETIFGAGSNAGGGTLASPAPTNAGDTHIPWNPMPTIPFVPPAYEEERQVLAGDVIASVFTKGKIPGSLPVDGSRYHAPFFMSTIFSDITVGAWAADVSATIDMAMTNFQTVQKSIAAGLHLADKNTGSPTNINLTFTGGATESYKWTMAANGNLMESGAVRFANWVNGCAAYNSAPTYHNQQFAAWNDNWLCDTGRIKPAVGLPPDTFGSSVPPPRPLRFR